MVGSAAARTDWRVGLAGAGGLLIAMVLVVSWYSSPADAPTSQKVSTTGDVGDAFTDMLRLAREPGLNALVVSGFFFGAAQFMLMAYVLLYLTEQLRFVPVVGSVLYTVTQLSGATTRFSLGIVTDA